MAEIKPIRAWRYNQDLASEMDALTSPLFDVVSDKQRDNLYHHPYNSIHLSVPRGPQSASAAASLLEEWKASGILKQDDLPAIYVYYQYFTLAGAPRELCRKGFICHIRAYDWSEKVILRHENTIPKSVNDRIDLLDKTQLHVSPTHGLYTDEAFELETYMDEAISNPIYVTEDYQGVRDVLGIIQDADVIQRFIDKLNEKPVILADGHHRYEASLIYRKQQAASNPHHIGDEGYNFHLMYLTNTEAHDLHILPTHRLIHGIVDFNPAKMMQTLANYFTIKTVEEPSTLPEIIAGKPGAFGIIFKDSAFKIRLKPESMALMTWPFPDVVKKLDLTILHYFVIEKALGIPGRTQRTDEHLDFNRSFSSCLTKVIQGDVQMAIITQEISIDVVKAVCHSGFTMPQKSTYFYPKVICGFLFSSIKENEFQSPAYSRF